MNVAWRVRYGGRAHECPCCGAGLRAFEDGARKRCPRCGSNPAQRVLALWLRTHPELTADPARVLHYEPDMALGPPLRQRLGERYLTGDLDTPLTTVPDASIDLVICSHALHRAADDIAVLGEMARVLRPGGIVVLQHQIVADRQTYENPTARSAQERLANFGNEDQRRVYGDDFAERPQAVGLTVELVRANELAGREGIIRYGIREAVWPAMSGNDLYVCRRPA